MLAQWNFLSFFTQRGGASLAFLVANSVAERPLFVGSCQVANFLGVLGLRSCARKRISIAHRPVAGSMRWRQVGGEGATGKSGLPPRARKGLVLSWIATLPLPRGEAILVAGRATLAWRRETVHAYSLCQVCATPPAMLAQKNWVALLRKSGGGFERVAEDLLTRGRK